MAYINPRLYNCSVPASFLADLPQLAQLCGNTTPPLSSDKSVEQIFSMQGEKFVSFAKSEKFVDGKMSNKEKKMRGFFRATAVLMGTNYTGCAIWHLNCSYTTL